METFTTGFTIVFTPAARAVYGPNAPIEDQMDRRFGWCCSPGDFVQFDGCNATFVVLTRTWRMGQDQETVRLLIDLLPEEPQLRPV